jgi:mRNA interferase MazF
MEVARGDLVIIALPGDYGKPRPALVVQDNAFANLESITVLRVTSDLRNWPLFRVTIAPTSENGLVRQSQIMIDKAVTAPRAKIGQHIGRIDPSTMRTVETALANFLGLG